MFRGGWAVPRRVVDFEELQHFDDREDLQIAAQVTLRRRNDDRREIRGRIGSRADGARARRTGADRQLEHDLTKRRLDRCVFRSQRRGGDQHVARSEQITKLFEREPEMIMRERRVR